MARRIVLVDIGNGLMLSGVLPSVALFGNYSARLVARGGVAPYTFDLAAGALPAGLYLDGGTGVISGTPTAAGTFPLTVRVTDLSGATVIRQFALTVIAEPLIVSGDAPNGTVAVAYAYNYVLTGGVPPYSVEGIGLPAGLAIDNAGHLSGAPTAGGLSNWVIRLTDSAGAQFDLADSATMAWAALALSGAYVAGQKGTAYSADLTIAGGSGIYSNPRVTVGALPAGLALSVVGNKLRLSGMPTTVATSNFTVAVDSSDGQSATSAQSVAIQNNVDPVALAIWNKLVYGFPFTEPHAANTFAALPSGSYAAQKTGAIDNSGALTAQGDLALVTTGGYLTIPFASSLSVSGDHTVMIWVKKASTGSPGTFPKLIWLGTGNDSLGYSNYQLFLETSTGKVYYRINTTDNAYHNAISPNPIAADTPTMIVGRLLGNTMQLLVNDAVVTTAAIDGTKIKPGVGPVLIGGGPSGATDPWVGSFASPALFKPALTDAEIAYLWNGGAGLALTTLKARAGVP